jgi:hypothetical protein
VARGVLGEHHDGKEGRVGAALSAWSGSLLRLPEDLVDLRETHWYGGPSRALTRTLGLSVARPQPRSAAGVASTSVCAVSAPASVELKPPPGAPETHDVRPVELPVNPVRKPVLRDVTVAG